LVLVYGVAKIGLVLTQVSLSEYWRIVGATGWTLGRVLLATALGTLWAVPAGLAIGLSPSLSAVLQPVIQIAASFPAPMLFPAVVAVLRASGISLSFGSVVLMLMGTQWYILFNVVAGATAIPADLLEAARTYRLSPLQRFRHVYLPAIFPYLVTGWVTAAGGAWNASIVTEYVHYNGTSLVTFGVGAMVSDAAEKANFAQLAATVTVMSTVVVMFNRSVWRSFYRLAREKYSLNR
jgi:NitT/TauT family transport system permease protein